MYKIIEQTRDEKLKLYMSRPKKELAEMLLNCNDLIDSIRRERGLFSEVIDPLETFSTISSISYTMPINPHGRGRKVKTFNIPLIKVTHKIKKYGMYEHKRGYLAIYNQVSSILKLNAGDKLSILKSYDGNDADGYRETVGLTIDNDEGKPVISNTRNGTSFYMISSGITEISEGVYHLFKQSSNGILWFKKH